MGTKQAREIFTYSKDGLVVFESLLMPEKIVLLSSFESF